MDRLIWDHLPDHVFGGIDGIHPDEHSDPWYLCIHDLGSMGSGGGGGYAVGRGEFALQYPN